MGGQSDFPRGISPFAVRERGAARGDSEKGSMLFLSPSRAQISVTVSRTHRFSNFNAITPIEHPIKGLISDFSNILAIISIM